ncbi:hypothetical protein [Mesonia maritima]|uniref:Lipoprotein n=1 Tax=Mesonia maritima TaxID=1793873 RepID=A0ABU1K2T0_9FLAO|nr:hypothetical protein [Mesonia maritima]MDR6299917.1 hypothetical protein [Mesonia maritima]
MKRITCLLLVTFTVFTISCSSDDNSSNVETLDEINQTEWEYEEENRGYYIYFDIANNVRISHPYYDPNSGEFYNEDIEGEFTYEKPTVTMSFYGQCNNSGFVFSSCDVIGTIKGNTLTVDDNGTKYKFTNMYPEE